MRFEIAFALVDEEEITGSGMEHSGSGHRQGLTQRCLKRDVYVHAGLELQTRIGKDKPDADCACVQVHLRQDELHAAFEDLSGISIHGDLGKFSRFNAANVSLK